MMTERMMTDFLSMPLAREDGIWRYTLIRHLGGTGPLVMFGLANPSIAGAVVPDPTLKRCIGFGKRLDASAVAVVNPCAYRAPNPDDLVAAWHRGVDVVGPDNEDAIRSLLKFDPTVIVGWGGVLRRLPPEPIEKFVNILRHAERGDQMEPRNLYCLGTTQRGEPRHPLMLSYEVVPVLWEWPLPPSVHQRRRFVRGGARYR